jgi:hypothetical protein
MVHLSWGKGYPGGRGGAYPQANNKLTSGYQFGKKAGKTLKKGQ